MLHLSTFADGWTDEHDLSLPLTGAMFDILVDIFHELLVARRLISPQVEELADVVEQRPEYEPLIQALFEETFRANRGGFKGALLAARDQLGLYLAQCLIRLSPDYLNYDDVAAVLLERRRRAEWRPLPAADRTEFRSARHRLGQGRSEARGAGRR